jgi:5'-nucleotidase (lipoprotein e(P4) family)
MKKIVLILVAFCGHSLYAQHADTAQSCRPGLKTLSVLWQQQAAEYRALCYQAFNIASWRLDQLKLKKKTHYAIIADIDETILDNSYEEAQRIKDNQDFSPALWKKWTDRSEATPVPGAPEFLQKAHNKGITIFYISNRDTTEVNSTVRNLKKFNLPDADAAHMVFSTGSSSKEKRRQKVMEGYEVIMLLGDNLNDFTALFEKKSSTDRKTETDNVRQQWGKRFIVLPNATYGEWENALYDYKRLPRDQKCLLLRSKLTGINP